MAFGDKNLILIRDRCKMRIERQLGIIGKAATDNEIEDMIEKSKNGESVPIFTGVSQPTLRSDEATCII